MTTTDNSNGFRVQITPKDYPGGKLADAELHFPSFTEDQRQNLETIAALTYTHPAAIAVQEAARLALALEGLRLTGFSIWDRKGLGIAVTYPSRQYSLGGERQSYALLRPIDDRAPAANGLHAALTDAYDQQQTPRGVVTRDYPITLNAEQQAEQRRIDAAADRIFDEGRKRQGFTSQAHLDAFYRYYDHTQQCDECQQPGEPAPIDDGYQPTRRVCDVAKQLFRDCHDAHSATTA